MLRSVCPSVCLSRRLFRSLGGGTRASPLQTHSMGGSTVCPYAIGCGISFRRVMSCLTVCLSVFIFFICCLLFTCYPTSTRYIESVGYGDQLRV